VNCFPNTKFKDNVRCRAALRTAAGNEMEHFSRERGCSTFGNFSLWLAEARPEANQIPH